MWGRGIKRGAAALTGYITGHLTASVLSQSQTEHGRDKGVGFQRVDTWGKEIQTD
jgi:hypothetical protein